MPIKSKLSLTKPNFAKQTYTLWVCCSVAVILSMPANADIHDGVSETESRRLTIDEIETRLAAARQDDSYYAVKTGFVDTQTGYANEEAAPVSQIGGADSPIGLDVANITALPSDLVRQMEGDVGQDDDTAEMTGDGVGINPDTYLPTYQDDGDEDEILVNDTETVRIKERNPLKRLYNRIFNDGADGLVRLDVTIYEQHGTDNDDEIARQKVDDTKEPYANIKAALSDITQESVLDFRSAAPRLRETAEAAARAVGYYDVDFRLVNQGDGKVDVVIHELGEPVKVISQAIDIRGQGADDKVFIEAKDNATPKVGEVFNHGAYTQSKERIDALKWEHGYFEGYWLNSYVDVLLPDNTADINLVYDTGEQYAFGDVIFYTFDPETRTLTADPDKLPVKLELLRQMVTFETGEPYSRTSVNNLSNELLVTKYFNAANVESVLPNLIPEDEGIVFENESNEVSDDEMTTIVLDEEAGVVAQISPIDFSPSQELMEKLGLVTAKAERLYNSPDDRVLAHDDTEPTSILGRVSHAISRIARAILPDESKDELPELPEGVTPPVLEGRKTADEVRAEKRVPLYIFVVADKPRDAHLGLGYGTDIGVRATARLEHNLLNRSGYQAGVQLNASRVEREATAYISRPLTHPNNDKLTASISYQEEEIDQGVAEYNMSSRTLEAALTRNLIQPSGWNRTYSLRYRLDELDTNAPRHTWQDLPVQFAENRTTQEAVLAGFAISKTVQDNLIDPRRGYRQSYSLAGGVDGFVSDTNMAIARASVGGIYSFGDNAYGEDRAHQLVGRLDAGYIWADDFGAVPYKLRFFAGGDQSLRGYHRESLSPVSPRGYLTGGQALAIGSLEYNYEVREGIRAAVFADVGNAYDRDFGNGTKVGAGVGVRWASPVGSVRVDVATGVNEENRSIQLHFMIGSAF